MTDAEILAVIRERIAAWRRDEPLNPEGRCYAKYTSPHVLLDDLDPDKLDQQGKMREELARDLIPVIFDPSERLRWADALLAKGWKK